MCWKCVSAPLTCFSAPQMGTNLFNLLSSQLLDMIRPLISLPCCLNYGSSCTAAHTCLCFGRRCKPLEAVVPGTFSKGLYHTVCNQITPSGGAIQITSLFSPVTTPTNKQAITWTWIPVHFLLYPCTMGHLKIAVVWSEIMSVAGYTFFSFVSIIFCGYASHLLFPMGFRCSSFGLRDTGKYF